MRHITTIACLVAIVSTTATAAVWFEEDFEDIHQLRNSAWQVDDAGGRAQVLVPGAQRLVVTFNSHEYTTVRLYVRLHHGTGTVWFMDVQSEELQIANPNFSEHEGDRIVGWSQDDVGETIFWDGEYAAGDGSARITRATDDGISRVYQNIECEADTEYRIEVWADSEDLQGSAYAEVYGVLEAGGLGAQLGASSHIRPPDPRFGSQVLSMHPRSGAVRISHQVTGSNDRLATLRAFINTEGMDDGQITFAVRDAGNGQPLAEQTHEVDPDARGFVPVRLDFFSPSDAPAEVRISVDGHGTALLDNITVGDIELPIPPQQVRLGALSDGCAPGSISAPTGDPVMANAIALVQERLGEMDAKGDAPVVVSITGGAAPVEWPESERYELAADADGVRITAATPVGAAWGLMTMLDLAEAGSGRIAECEIVDWPAMPFRGTYHAGVPTEQALVDICRQLVRLKMNALVMESGTFYQLGDEQVREQNQDVFDTLRAWGIEPIPELQSLGHAGPQLSRNPHCVEGAWQRDEELTLVGIEAVALEHPNVLRTEVTDIVIASPDGAITYVEGEDYEVIDGVTGYPYTADAEPYRIRRIEDGAITDGATVLASYDHAVKMGGRNIPYCPSEPAVYDIMFPAIENTIRLLDVRTLHIGHDEPRIVNSDSRCLKREMTGGELLAEDITKLNDFAHSVDERVTLMMWADALNPHHNGTWFSGENEEQLDLVPKDVVQNIWFYGPTDPLTRGRDSFAHFQRYGFTFTGSPWDDTTCCRNWGIVADEARRKGMNCEGLLYTSWSRRWGGLEILAAGAWNPPSE